MRERHSARAVALAVLSACRQNNAWADASLRAHLDRSSLSSQDASLCSRIVYGVIQNQTLLDFYLSACCIQPLEKLQKPLPDILRMGAYQILMLDKVPDRAAVHESVELAKAAGLGRASGLVNAVLRRLSGNKASLPTIPGEDPVEELSVRYSHPAWLVRDLVNQIGAEETEAFLRANNSAAPITIQVNPLQTKVADLSRELSSQGVSVCPHSWIPGCLELSGAGNLTALSAFQKGHFLVQDGAARLVTLAAGIHPGQSVLDVCAAPGGKSFSAAFAMENRGKILSCDLHEKKLKRIREGALRLGITCLETVAADGRVFHPEWAGQFDTVLVDAPCSGLGIIRKKPDIRWKDPRDFSALPGIQLSILKNASAYVRPGGVLVYSTCTIRPEENEAVTDAFLADSPMFSMRPFSLLPEEARMSHGQGQSSFAQDQGANTRESSVEEKFLQREADRKDAMNQGFPDGNTEGRITLWPQRHDTDGFYLCAMVRRREESL